MNHDTDDDTEDAASVAETFFSDSTGHDSRMPDYESTRRIISVHPGAIRVDGESGTEVHLHRGPVNVETEEEDVSCIVPNNNGSSDVVVSSASQPEEQPSPVEGITVQEPRLEDLTLTRAAPVEESPSDASVAPVWELVNRLDHPVVEAVILRGPAENTGEGGLEINEELNHTMVCGLPSLWIKWLALLSTMTIIVVVLVFSLGPKPHTPDPTSTPSTPNPSSTPFAVPASTPSTPEPTSTPSTQDPISIIFNLLVEYIPDLPDRPLRKSAEYRAMEWLTQDNGTIFIKDENGTFFTEDIESLVQRYVMVVFYYETVFSTNSASKWLSSQPTCTWVGLECDEIRGTSITRLLLGK
jgi:hypothetical protein